MKAKRILTILSLMTLALFALCGISMAQGASGATLQADKTVDICYNGDGTWTYSGAVSVWNIGVNDALNYLIYDVIESKTSGPKFTTNYVALDDVSCGNLSGTVPGGTMEGSAFVTTYSVTRPPLSGTIRNNAQVTISNHSGANANGPNPKATYYGVIPPPACPSLCGGSALPAFFLAL
jgi:hypothetical protein